MNEEMHQVIAVARMAASLILSNGGETYRAEETAVHIGRTFGCEIDVIALPTGLTMTVRRGGDSATSIARVSRRTTDLARLERVNAISRALESRDMALDEARRELERLSRPAAARVGLSAAAGGGSAAMFALMFLGDGFDMLAAGLISAAVQAVLCFLPDQEGMPLTCLIGGFLVAALSLAVVSLCGMGDADRIILSNMMPLLPGLAFTNAIRDSMHGDMVSGGARICDAVMRAVILATGAGIAMLAVLRIGGGIAWWM